MVTHFLSSCVIGRRNGFRAEIGMKTTVISAFLLFVVVLAGCGEGPNESRATLDEFIAAERSFAAMAVTNGTRSSFLSYLADSSLIFLPEPTDGRSHYEVTEDTGVLSWEPVFADISADGSLAYSTGPWTFQGDVGVDQPPIHGHYISVWSCSADGKWKVILDIGITYPDPFPGGGPAEKASTSPPVSETDVGKAKAELVALDHALSAATDRVQSLLAASGPDARFYRNGERPVRGRESAMDLMNLVLTESEEPPDRERWDPIGAGVAGSGDLGYTYGYTGVSEEATSYLRIWRRKPGAGWKIVLDVVI
jgi:ketosteroid isomerase-like protein